MIDAFLDYLKNKKGMSGNTVEAYKRDMIAFEKYLSAGGSNLSDVTNTDIVSYMLDLKNSGKSKSTVNRKLATLRSFYGFLMSKGIITENPTESIKSPKIERKKIEYLTYEEVLKLLEVPDDSIMGQRDRAMLELLYATGIRVSEMIELRLSDVNLSMGFVKLSGEHGRARIVPLGVPAKKAVDAYIKNGRRILYKSGNPADPAGMLFVNYMGEPFTRQGFWKVLRQYGKKAGLDDRLTPQTLRNTFAMHMVQNGIDIKPLQELMGHEDIAATQVYFGDSKNRIKDIYDRTHPRAK